MKNKLIAIFAATILMSFAAVAGWSQMLAKVHGKCIALDGKPMAGITVQFHNEENGQNYDLKTDDKGNFASIALVPGKYKISLIQDGKTVQFYTGVVVKLSEQGMEFNFDLQKEMQEAQKNPEYQKKVAEQAKQNDKITTLNQKLKDAALAQQAGKWQEAIDTLNSAIAIDDTHDIIWARLADAEAGAGTAATNKEEAAPHFDKALSAYKKAIDIVEKAPAPEKPAAAEKKAADPKVTAGKYHNNLGQVYAKTGKPKEALDEYTTAADDDPPNAAMYYFNAGATLTNQATRESDQATKVKDIDDANTAFDKAIAVKPDYAEAYYQKGINLTSKATIDKSGKMVPAQGTVEAFNKYLEIEPEGKHAAEAKGLIEGFGETVQTTYKKAKASPPSKK